MIMKNGEDQEQEDTPNSSSEDLSMVSLDAKEEEGEGGSVAAMVLLGGEGAGTGDNSEETKRANRILETVSLWICNQIRYRDR